MKTILICILLLLCSFSIGAQNMIPDSSFEKNKAVPTDFSAIGYSYSWNRASWGTTDLFCKCDKKKEKKYSLVDVPQNPMGYQEAHSGTCYAGIFAFSHGNYREYLQTPLTSPLEKNKIYLFTMYISLADYSRTSVDQLGVCFLPAKVIYDNPNAINGLNPVYIKLEKEVGKVITEWHPVSVTYKAKGGETSILIGSFVVNKISKTKFKVPKEIRSRINQHSERDAYYYIDDVSLVETVSVEPESGVLPEAPDTISADTMLVLKNVLFQTNKASLLPSSYPELDLLAAYLIKNSGVKISIYGHTDNSGNEKTNKKLSEQRAKAVSDYLSSKGIDKTRITHTGYGSSVPIAPNETEAGRRQNRRVEFIITD